MGSVKSKLDELARQQLAREANPNDTLNVFTGKINTPRTVMGSQNSDLGKSLFDFMVSVADRGAAKDWKAVQSFAEKGLDMSGAAQGSYTINVGGYKLSLKGPASNGGQVPDIRQLRIIGKE